MANIAYAQLFDWRQPSARAAGMSGAQTAIANDVWAGYYNPAGLPEIENIRTGVAYYTPFNISFLKSYFGAVVLPINSKWGTVSFSIDNFGVVYKGEDMSTETSMTFSHGRYIFKDYNSSLSIGYNIRLLSWSLGHSLQEGDLGSATQLALDVGFRATLYDRTMIGIYVSNLNNPEFGEIHSHELPPKVVIGFAYIPYSGVTTAFDIKKDIGRDETQFWGGAEFQLNKYFCLRSGAMANPNRFTFGTGITYDNLIFDYAILTHSELAETHQFGIRFTW